MDNTNKCPSIYQGTFSNPLFVEQFILIIYSLIFLIGLVGNIMTIIIIKFNTHLRTPTNSYLLNLAVSDLMMLMCNLPLEMLEIYHREWPLSIIFCKLRNICAEFFTCSSILTILAFTCERYFAIVHPVHFHRLSHFRRSQNIIFIIWLISLGCSLPLGFSYKIETNSSSQLNSSSNDCKSCVPEKSVANILPIIVIITSFCFFYFPMIIIGAIYLFIGKALRRVNKNEGYSNQIELSTSSQSSNRIILRKCRDATSHLGLSNKETIEMQQQGSHISSYSWLKMRARCQARQVVVKTLVAVVIAFFVCYAPMYLQRLLLAITTLNSNITFESSFFSSFLAYLYVISGITFYFGSVINPILYNVVSNKYRRAFRDLFYCRLANKKKLNKSINQNFYRTNRSQKRPIRYCTKQQSQQQIQEHNTIKISGNLNQQITINIIKKPLSSQSNSHEKNKRSNPYQ